MIVVTPAKAKELLKFLKRKTPAFGGVTEQNYSVRYCVTLVYGAFMKKTIIVLALALALSACNTIQGMGEDIGAAGDAISGTATKTKQKM